MGRALSWLVTLATLATLAREAAAQSPTILRDVRVGAHESYDRVVIELDGPTDIAWERGPELGAESFYLSADPIRTRTIKTRLPRVGDITVSPMRGGTRVYLEPRERRVRAYLLAKPPRLVIDLASPGEGAFKPPAGVQALTPATAVAIKAEPEPEPRPEPEPKAEPEPKPQSTPEPTPAPAQAETPTPPAPAQPEAIPAPPAPAPEPQAQPEPEPQPEVPPQAETPPPPAPPAPAPPEPAPPAPETDAIPPESESIPWTALLSVLLGAAALAAVGLAVRARAGRRSTASTATDASYDGGVDAFGDFTDEDVRRAADATTLLEQRLDEEVRARVALEERLAQAGEELKVLRDRLYRVERKREDEFE